MRHYIFKSFSTSKKMSSDCSEGWECPLSALCSLLDYKVLDWFDAKWCMISNFNFPASILKTCAYEPLHFKSFSTSKKMSSDCSEGWECPLYALCSLLDYKWVEWFHLLNWEGLSVWKKKVFDLVFWTGLIPMGLNRGNIYWSYMNNCNNRSLTTNVNINVCKSVTKVIEKYKHTSNTQSEYTLPLRLGFSE